MVKYKNANSKSFVSASEIILAKLHFSKFYFYRLRYVSELVLEHLTPEAAEWVNLDARVIAKLKLNLR